jgi:peptidoglycan/LPS O-acetylase OafA/YrhL
MDYRREIDGLRALAVLPVVLFHAGFETFSGGFVGVDVFFVISGYLITSIIYSQINNGIFSAIDFYDKRARRLLPALLITALITSVLSTTFSPSDIKNVGQSLVSLFAFLSNYFFYLETDYFNPFNHSTPLLHTWSLAVEEQFYILFPLILFISHRILNAKFLVLCTLFLVSFYLSLNLTLVNSNLSFYSFHTRAWELLAGSILALLPTPSIASVKNNKPSDLLSLIGLFLIFCSYLLISKSDKHPYFVTILPVFGSCLVIYFSRFSTISKRILGNYLLVLIGLISYPLYLLHNPIFSFIDYHVTDGSARNVKFLSVPFVIFASFLIYRFVERKVRNNDLISAKLFYSFSFLSILIFVLLGYNAHTTNGFLEHFKNRLVERGGIPLVNVEEEKRLIEEKRKTFNPVEINFTCKNSSCTKILVIGDSFAEDAYLSLRSLSKSGTDVRKINLDDTCFDSISDLKSKVACDSANVDLSLISASDVVIISAKWQESTYKEGFRLAELIAEKSSAKVALVGSVMFEDLSSFSFKTVGLNENYDSIATLAYRNQRFDRLRISDKLRNMVLKRSDIKWIEKSDFFCISSKNQCNLFVDGSPLIWDNAHLTVRAYDSYGKFLLKNIDKYIKY